MICHHPLKFSPFSLEKLPGGKAIQWFDLLEHGDCQFYQLHSTKWERPGILVCKAKKILIKMTIVVLNYILKSVWETTTWLEEFSCRKTFPCQVGISTCESHCSISCKVTRFQICSLGSQELFNIFTCHLKSTFFRDVWSLWEPQSWLLAMCAKHSHLLVIVFAAGPVG